MPLYGTQAAGMTSLDSTLSNRIQIDMSEMIKFVEPEIYPFTRLVDQLDYADCKAEKFEFMQADDFDAFVTLSTGALAEATTLVLVTGDYPKIVKNMTLRNMRTGEISFVSATPTTTSVTILANWPTCSGGAAHLAGDKMLILGTTMEDGSTPVDVRNIEPARSYNYIEKMREGWKVSGRVEASALYGPTALEFAKKTHLREFMKQRERKLLFQTRGRVTAATSGLDESTTSTGGIRYFMDAAGSDCASRDFTGVSVTKAEFDNFLQDAFMYGGDRKLMICGWNILRIIDGWADNKLQTVQGAKEYGNTIKRYECTYGILDIMPHKAWTNEFGMNDEAWIVQLDNMVRRGLPGRSNMQLTTTAGSDKLQAIGEDATRQELTVEDGLELRNIETFARAYGIGA